MATKTKVSAAGQSRVSAKVAHLVRGGEVPNTAEGRKKALGMAYGMEEAGRLGERGAYRRVGKPKPAASRPYTPRSKAVPRMANGGLVANPRKQLFEDIMAQRRAEIASGQTLTPAQRRKNAFGAWQGRARERTKPIGMAKGGVVKHSKAHPGFKAVQAEIASNITPRRKGQSKKEAAGAILASSSRHASKAAHRANPRLSRVKG